MTTLFTTSVGSAANPGPTQYTRRAPDWQRTDVQKNCEIVRGRLARNMQPPTFYLQRTVPWVCGWRVV